MDYYFARYKVKQTRKYQNRSVTSEFNDTILLANTHPIEFEKKMQDMYGGDGVSNSHPPVRIMEDWTLLNWNKISEEIYKKHKNRYE